MLQQHLKQLISLGAVEAVLAHELDTALCPDGAAVDGRLLQQCQQLLSAVE